MLRHACGYKLVDDGRDKRSLQHYLGYKRIMHTVSPHRVVSPERFKKPLGRLTRRATYGVDC